MSNPVFPKGRFRFALLDFQVAVEKLDLLSPLGRKFILGGLRGHLIASYEELLRQRDILAGALRDALAVDGGPYEEYHAQVAAILWDALREAGMFPDVKTCEHVFEANPAMNDSLRRFCTKCGIVEDTSHKTGGGE